MIGPGSCAPHLTADGRRTDIPPVSLMLATAFLKQPDKTPPGPIAAVFGAERLLKQLAIQELLRIAFNGQTEEADPLRFAGKAIDFAAVIDSLRTVAMWTPRQVVIVEEADEFVSEHRAALEKYLEKPARKGVLILDVKSWPSNTRLAKKTAEIGLPIDCNPLKLPELLTWLVERARSRLDKSLDRGAAQLLTELAGTDLGLLDQELEKLASYIGQEKKIDNEAVRKLVGGWKAETTWKMLDSVRDGHLAEALVLLDKLLRMGEPGMKLLGGIQYVYRPIARATELSRGGMPLHSALSDAGVKPFAITPTQTYLKRLGRPRAEQILNSLLQMDVDLKGWSALPERVLLERLLVRLSGAVPTQERTPPAAKT